MPKKRDLSLEDLLSNKDALIKRIHKLGVEELIVLMKHFWLKGHVNGSSKFDQDDTEIIGRIYRNIIARIEYGTIKPEVLANSMREYYRTGFYDFIVRNFRELVNTTYEKNKKAKRQRELAQQKEDCIMERLNDCLLALHCI